METDSYYIRPPYRRIRMPISQRAKQFAPFAALSGYESAIEEAEIRHLKSNRRILSEDAAREINKVLCMVSKDSKIKVCYYYEGRYELITGRVIHNDRISKFIRIGGGVCDDVDFSIKILYSDIYSISLIGSQF